MDSYKTIELRCQAIKRSFGLFDHYFYIIDDREVHMGKYRRGKIMPKGTTKGSHIIAKIQICESCYNKIILDLTLKEDVRLAESYFPILNCESLCTGVSIQTVVLIISIPFALVLLIKGLYLWVIILILASIVFLLAYSKFMFSKTRQKKCEHIKIYPTQTS